MKTIIIQQQGNISFCNIDISKEEWLEILKAESTPEEEKCALLQFYYMPNHRGTCTSASLKYGGSPQILNTRIWQFGRRVQHRLGNFQVIRSNGKQCFWIIPMNNGKDLSRGDAGSFEYELRPELVEAIKEYLYWYLVEQYKKLREYLPLRSIESDELYKWELITRNQGKAPIDIVEGKFDNLIDQRYDTKTINFLLNDKREEYKEVLADLINEEISLNQRLAKFKESIKPLLPSEGYSSMANDERTAASILTCYNPKKYTFYKHRELYDRLCLFFGEQKQKTGLCYSHYLDLLAPLARLAAEDVSLQTKIQKQLEGLVHSDLLLAQDIAWMLLARGDAKRTGYIFNILFPTSKTLNDMNTQSKYSEYIELLKSNKNLILTGAPGTGKTYMAREIAAELLGVNDVADLEVDKHFGFVQFHPSYDYTDFVEGLRPTAPDENGNIGFERKNGVFKEFCARASERYQTNGFDDAYENLLETIESEILILKTPRGKEFGISINSKGNLKLHTGPDLQINGVLTRESLKAEFAGTPTYEWWKGYYEGVVTYLKDHYNLVQRDNEKDKKFVFVIDEINRGEISKIFGELFFSIDLGYRGKAGMVQTQYQNMVEDGEFKEGFYVPENVYIIGTMNDIDRSVESMDFAMRRRFAWKEVTAEESMQMLDGMPNEEMLKNRMRNLNEAILKVNGLGSAYQIGAAYFKKYEQYQDFEKLWQYHLSGLLAEYLRGSANAEQELKEMKKAYDNESLKDAAANNDNG